MNVALSFQAIEFPLAKVFRIARGAKTCAHVIEVQLMSQGCVGRAESVPYSRYQESVTSVSNQLLYVQEKLNKGMSVDSILKAMAPGAAKNALDCAFWDLKAKLANCTVEQLMGIDATPACISAQTLSIDEPDVMADAAKALQHPPIIKVKLDGENILTKMRAIHKAAPFSQFIVDANEGWSFEDLTRVCHELAKLNVVLIEQPLPVGLDNELKGFQSPVALCADESCHTRHDLPYLIERYDAINIKLDKTGGLTEAMALAKEAKSAGLVVMIGCMVGSSLAMAPAYLLNSFASYVDLDGPLLVAQDRPFGFTYSQGVMQGLDLRLWGGQHDADYLKMV